MKTVSTVCTVSTVPYLHAPLVHENEPILISIDRACSALIQK